MDFLDDKPNIFAPPDIYHLLVLVFGKDGNLYLKIESS
ncbi:hypothetical protein B4082_3795 [Bacillus cereus]|uniref:Uncharacterized protein n=1 Tax=Bacillus cereus TaxID=1396 RepID=A0A164DKU4_BACCE|nr:hypothetical protein B4082_3795 [Bacillus cereus]